MGLRSTRQFRSETVRRNVSALSAPHLRTTVEGDEAKTEMGLYHRIIRMGEKISVARI